MTRELGSLGIRVPEGYAVTADAYRYFLRANDLEAPIGEAMAGLERGDVEGLRRTSRSIQNSVIGAEFPEDLETEILRGYGELSALYGEDFTDVAVRSSATAEDLPTASFAGQQESFLNVHGDAQLLDSVKRCFASLFTPRAISYREDMGFDHSQVALSVGVQKMVRSDLASSGVIFTLDTESGFPDVVFVTSTWGLGENIVQGRVVPDGFYVHKPTLAQGYAPLIRKRLGTKEFKLVYDATGHRLVENVPTSEEDETDLLRLRRGRAPARALGRGHRGPLQREARDQDLHGRRVGQGRPYGRALHPASPPRDRARRGSGADAAHAPPQGAREGARRGARRGQRGRHGPGSGARGPERDRELPKRRGARHGDHRPRLGADHEDRLRHSDGARTGAPPTRPSWPASWA